MSKKPLLYTLYKVWEPPFKGKQVISHLLNLYSRRPLELFGGLQVFDYHLDDMCDACGEYYCNPCEDKGEYRSCQSINGYDCVERCPKIPCLDCATYKTRDFFDLEVEGTIGSLSEMPSNITSRKQARLSL